MCRLISGESAAHVVAKEADEPDRKWESVDQFESLNSEEEPDLQPAELHQRMRRS